MGLKAAVSGLGYFQGDFIGLEGTIKSSERHPDKLGGWAYDSFTNLEGEEVNKTAKMFEITLLVYRWQFHSSPINWRCFRG